MADGITTSGITIGLDLGDRQTAGCVLDATGQVLTRWQVRTTRSGLQAAVAPWPGARVILEVGPQSPWVSRGLTAAGYAVVVANARRVRLIAESDAKSD
ncbi:MAG: IS110 family transposase, partial [Vicinamibacterales bacterium]|nr:IS110 family transposase [Vicinamibacterales bacterium]